jgi:hypothetical protein
LHLSAHPALHLSVAQSKGDFVIIGFNCTTVLRTQKIHGNSLLTDKPAVGYTLRDKDTGEILKYGETTRGQKRYTQKFYRDNNAEMQIEAQGTKKEMHTWQNDRILEHKLNNNGNRPSLNKSDW